MKPYYRNGFTLIELLMVISIIGLLSSIVLSNLQIAQMRGRNARRIADLKQVQRALEHYAYEHANKYPSTGGLYRSQCARWGSYTSTTVIPGLVPGYLDTMPKDPLINMASNYACYIYISDGNSYKFYDRDIVSAEISAFTYADYPAFYDPVRDNGVNNCAVEDASKMWAWSVWGGVLPACVYPGGVTFPTGW